MRHSTDSILTTHVGALPAPQEVWSNPGADLKRLREEVANVIRRQRADVRGEDGIGAVSHVLAPR